MCALRRIRTNGSVLGDKLHGQVMEVIERPLREQQNFDRLAQTLYDKAALVTGPGVWTTENLGVEEEEPVVLMRRRSNRERVY